jgi:hypothetical protein
MRAGLAEDFGVTERVIGVASLSILAKKLALLTGTNFSDALNSNAVAIAFHVWKRSADRQETLSSRATEQREESAFGTFLNQHLH